MKTAWGGTRDSEQLIITLLVENSTFIFKSLAQVTRNTLHSARPASVVRVESSTFPSEAWLMISQKDYWTQIVEFLPLLCVCTSLKVA